MKRAGDGFGDRDRGGPKQGRSQRYGEFAFKVLCPEPMVAKLMGEKGAAVHQIEDQTSTHLQFSPRNDFYPDTRLRVLTILGSEPGFVFEALMAMVDQIISRGNDDRDNGRHDDFIDQKGRIIFRCALSKAAAGAIIGSKGDRVRRLRESSGAHIDIEREVVDNHQLVTVCGSREQLTQVIEEFNGTVQSDAQEAWFQQWASQRSIGSDGGGGGGPPPRAERRREGGGHRGDRDDRDADGGGRRSHSTLKHRGCTIFVGRLAQATTTDTLKDFFQQFGEVEDADVRTDPATGRSKGFGFITFTEQGAVEACLEARADHQVDGRWVDVKRYGENDHEDRHADAPPEHFDEPPHHGGGGARVGGGFAPPQHADDRREERQNFVPQPPPPSVPRNGGWDHREHRPERRGAGGAGMPPSGFWGGDHAGGDPRGTVHWFGNLASHINPEYLGLNYCITCSLPSAKCGALIGRRGEHITEVQRTTGAEIAISKKDPHESADAHRTVTITGPLLSVYGAHMLLMRHYNDEEAQFQAHRAADPGMQVEDLQRQVAELTQELATVQRRGGGPSGGGSRGDGPRVPTRRR